MTITSKYNTMDKDYTYWNIHKEVYNTFLNELDNTIIDRIYKNPNCTEAKLLNNRVNKEIEERLNKESTA
jgi:hypothetical protein